MRKQHFKDLLMDINELYILIFNEQFNNKKY